MSSLTLAMVVPGDPIAKARPAATIIGGHAHVYTPKRSKEFEYLVKLSAREQMGERAPLEAVPLSVTIEYRLTIPSSFSNKKREGAIHGFVYPTPKPDIDNLVKATLDGMLGVVFKDDAIICDLIVSKRYSVKPCTWIRVELLDGVAARPLSKASSSPAQQDQLPLVPEERRPF